VSTKNCLDRFRKFLTPHRYKPGSKVKTVAGGKELDIVNVDDEKIYIKNPLWQASLSRKNLERAVQLIEQGKMTRDAGAFVDEYKTYVEDERSTSAAHVLKDLGYLN
ncbi:MAG: hypothetical protein ACE5JS_20725, partial [Nitrospinota bacterium]